MGLLTPDRSQYPATRPDGSLDIYLSSRKYLKLWQGPQHPGITGNMAVELTVFAGAAPAETYYVRTDGGSEDHCSGLADAPYVKFEK